MVDIPLHGVDPSKDNPKSDRFFTVAESGWQLGHSPAAMDTCPDTGQLVSTIISLS